MRATTTISLWLLAVLISLPALAQSPISPDKAAAVAEAFDHVSHASNTLKCDILKWGPTLDFAFRFESGYQVLCRLGLFGGKATQIHVDSRVTPRQGSALLLEDGYQLPEASAAERRREDPWGLKELVDISGGFASGTGEYLVEVLVRDNHGRTCHKRWTLHVSASRSQRQVSIALAPLAVEPIDPKWDITSPAHGGGVRVTVLMNAAAMNPYQPVLHAWDRAVLLQSLYSLARQLPYGSLRVVAFNLEQQREVFRQDNFDAQAFAKLSQTLSAIETETVGIEALQQRDSPHMLVELARDELSADHPSDLVLFLGPHARLEANITPGVLERKSDRPRFFYYEYYEWVGSDFSDAIDQLTRALDGKTIIFHSPTQLGQEIQKMLGQLKLQ